jgi:DNA-binding NarL/FixJ family response regulator
MPDTINKKPMLIIAEDNPRDREFLVDHLTGFDLILTEDPTQAIELSKNKDNPNIITDLQMPQMNGISLAKTIWQDKPNAKILFWSNYGDETYIRSLIKIIPQQTVYGYILKDNTSDILLKAVTAVFIDEQCWIDPKLRPAQNLAMQSDSGLTDTDYEVLVDISLGLTDKLIAERRFLSHRGAQNRLKTLYLKLGVAAESSDTKNLNIRSRAISVALRRGLINTDEIDKEEVLFQQWTKQHQRLNH